MAGDRQGAALRVFAPQRGALLGSPGRFPFFNQFNFAGAASFLEFESFYRLAILSYRGLAGISGILAPRITGNETPKKRLSLLNQIRCH
jgi:hypothetical protein